MILIPNKTNWSDNMKEKKNIDELLKSDFNFEKSVVSLSLYIELLSRKEQLIKQARDRFEQCLSEEEFEHVQTRLRHDLLKPIDIYSNNYFEIEFTFLSIDKNILITKKYIYVTVNDYILQYDYAGFLKITYEQFCKDVFNQDNYKFAFVLSKQEKMKALQQNIQIIQQSFL